MNKDILKSAISFIKASDEFSKKVSRLMMEKSFPKTAVGKHYKRLIAVTVSFVLIVGTVGAFIRYESNLQSKSVGDGGIPAIEFGGKGGAVFVDDERVCEMFLSSGSMYYTDHMDTLYCYDNSSGKGEVVSKIEISNGGQVFENKGYIYYGNGSAIFRRSLGGGASVQLVTGKNIGVDKVSIGAVGGSRLVYCIAYKDANGRGFSEFEYRMYDLVTSKDIVLFKRSDDMWHFLDADGNIVIADTNLQNDSGLYAIDLETGIKKKLLSLRVHEGYITNGKFYYTSHAEKDLRSIDLNGDVPEEIPLTDMGQENFFLDRITGFGDFLFVAAYFDGENHIIRVDLKTRETTILADGFGRVWRLCSDGKTLYAYDTKSPADRKGNITVIPLE